MIKSVKITASMSNQGTNGSPQAEAERNRIKHVSVSHVRRFFRAIPSQNLRDRLLFDLIYHYALRRSEVVIIELGDIDLKKDTIEIHRRKGGDSHSYPLFARTKQLLLRYLDEPRRVWSKHLFPSRQKIGEPISASLVAHLFREYAKAADLPRDRQHVHVFRHSMGMHMAETGLDGLDMQDWMGHTSFNSTRQYLGVTDRRRSKSLKAMTRSPDIA
jgi:integrase